MIISKKSQEKTHRIATFLELMPSALIHSTNNWESKAIGNRTKNGQAIWFHFDKKSYDFLLPFNLINHLINLIFADGSEGILFSDISPVALAIKVKLQTSQPFQIVLGCFFIRDFPELVPIFLGSLLEHCWVVKDDMREGISIIIFVALEDFVQFWWDLETDIIWAKDCIWSLINIFKAYFNLYLIRSLSVSVISFSIGTEEISRCLFVS